MKKSLKFLLIILAVIIIGVVAVLVMANKTEEIEVATPDDSGAVLDLGKYKVSDYDSGRSTTDGFTQEATFSVDDQSDFYNNIILTSEYYSSDLDYSSDEYCGYLICEGHVFSYLIESNNVTISSVSGYFDIENEGYDTIYYLIGPLGINIDFDSTDTTDATGAGAPYSGFNDTSIENVETLYSYLDSSLYKIEDDIVYVKAYTSCSIDDDGNIDYATTDNYIAKIYESDGTIYVTYSND